jgi:glycosyltransferase involved in cell wall biosynthesis
MKKLLIVNNNMHLGGVQRSLVDLLKSISGRYEITLLLFSQNGELAEQIPKNINVISPCVFYKAWGITKDDCPSRKEWLLRAFMAGITKTIGRKTATCIADMFQKKLRGFDVAVSFLHSAAPKVFYGGCNEFVLHNVEAPLKVTFLHCDYESIGASSKYNERVYAGFDRIAACSDGCKNAFMRVMPGFEERIFTVHNCHDYVRIRKLAEKMPVHFDKKKFNVLSVARFGKEKGMLRAVSAVADLCDETDALRYYIIGKGIEYYEAQKMIDERRMRDRIFLLGEDPDPYRYMKAADVLLIPSIAEAAPLVIDEAACLGTPVLSTETSSAVEYVTERNLGWVCSNTKEGIIESIRMLMNEPSLIKNTREYISGIKLDNDTAVEEFDRLLRK